VQSLKFSCSRPATGADSLDRRPMIHTQPRRVHARSSWTRGHSCHPGSFLLAYVAGQKPCPILISQTLLQVLQRVRSAWPKSGNSTASIRTDA